MLRSAASILLIETSALMRRSLQEMFEAEGYNVSGAGSYQDALLAVREIPYDIIIVDLVEPELTDDLVRHIFQRALGSPVHIVLREPKLQLENAPQAGQTVEADTVLNKPIDLDELRAMVRDAVFRKALLRPKQADRPAKPPKRDYGKAL